MDCKHCKWCTWTCPGWMCINPKHPEFSEDDYPLMISLNDNCELFEEKNEWKNHFHRD